MPEIREGQPNMEKNRLRKWPLLFAACTFVGLLSATTFYTEQLLEEDPVPFIYFLVNELTAAYSVLLLLPLMLPFIGRFPVTRAGWQRALPFHLAASVAFGASHTVLMTIARTALYPPILDRSYRMGDPLYRFLLEYQKQVLVYAAIVVVVHLVNLQNEKRAKEREASELQLRTVQMQSRLAEANLAALRGQVQPHFLFNALNMISSLMYEDVGRADRMIARLSQFLRMSLDHVDRQKVRLAQEFEFVHAYLEIMSARFEDRLQFTLELPPQLGSVLVPAFLLQPLVENAVKHGDSRDGRSLRVIVRAAGTDRGLEIEVLDDGSGIAGEAGAPLREGVGLSNTRGRLDQLYGRDWGLEITTRPEGGCAVHIRIPLEPDRTGAATAGGGRV